MHATEQAEPGWNAQIREMEMNASYLQVLTDGMQSARNYACTIELVEVTVYYTSSARSCSYVIIGLQPATRVERLALVDIIINSIRLALYVS